MNDYQFDAIYAEMKKAHGELLAAISRNNRWAAFSDEELERLHTGLASTWQIDSAFEEEIEAEQARRNSEGDK